MDAQLVTTATQTQTMVQEMVNKGCQTDNIVHKVSMRCIGTNVDTGEKEFEMIMD